MRDMISTFGEKTPTFAPDTQCAKLTSGTGIPGGKCTACEIRRMRMRQIMAPLIQSAHPNYSRLDGELYVLTFCALPGKE